MNATYWFFGLVGVFVGLLAVALVKPYFTKNTANTHPFKNKLAKLLPHHDLLVKQGTPSRIIVSLDGIQKAIIVIDAPRDEYCMGGLPIFTTNKSADLANIAQQISTSTIVIN